VVGINYGESKNCDGDKKQRWEQTVMGTIKLWWWWWGIIGVYFLKRLARPPLLYE
jgi:hypothetical protein